MTPIKTLQKHVSGKVSGGKSAPIVSIPCPAFANSRCRNIRHAVIYSPGLAVFGDCLLSLTENAREIGLNLAGHEISDAWECESGGVWVSRPCEDKHFSRNGKIDN